MRGGKGRILIVEDEEGIRRNLRGYLGDEGFEVSGAESGEEALEMLTHSRFDAAVVDIRLPGIDGNTFIERAHDLYPKLGFLVFTGSAAYQLPERFSRLNLRETPVLVKPLRDMAVLVSALMGILQTRD